jgi:hypothetical protein
MVSRLWFEGLVRAALRAAGFAYASSLLFPSLTFPQEGALKLNELDYFEARGLNVLNMSSVSAPAIFFWSTPPGIY